MNIGTPERQSSSKYIFSTPIQRSCVQPGFITHNSTISNDRVASVELESALRYKTLISNQIPQVTLPICTQSGMTQNVKVKRSENRQLTTEINDRQITPLRLVGIDSRLNELPSFTSKGFNTRQLLQDAVNIIRQDEQ